MPVNGWRAGAGGDASASSGIMTGLKELWWTWREILRRAAFIGRFYIFALFVFLFFADALRHGRFVYNRAV